ncbi:MAG: OmpH family outer membrane protein [bacterium]
MKNFKKFLITLAIMGALMFSGVNAFAKDAGVVDLDKVIGDYSKAQDASADLKIKEAELQKFLADAQKQLKNAASPVERKNLEDKLTEEFKVKSQNFRELQAKQWKEIEDSVFSAIDKISKEKDLSLILNKAGVLRGGVDITEQILGVLNKKDK